MIEENEEKILQICDQIELLYNSIKDIGYKSHNICEGIKELRNFIKEKVGKRLASKLFIERNKK